jgi:hypothetical protein
VRIKVDPTKSLARHCNSDTNSNYKCALRSKFVVLLITKNSNSDWFPVKRVGIFSNYRKKKVERKATPFSCSKAARLEFVDSEFFLSISIFFNDYSIMNETIFFF